jgi:hypothetical protein
MKTFLTLIAQSHANLIIKRMERCETEESLDYWFKKGMTLNNLCVSYEIYLD